MMVLSSVACVVICECHCSSVCVQVHAKELSYKWEVLWVGALVC